MRILAFDPGETTGWAVNQSGGKIRTGTIRLHQFGMFERLIERAKPQLVVIEKFVLYPWAVSEQTWSDFPTVEVIGIIKFICWKHEIPYAMQPASSAKAKWMMRARVKGSAHERDATRHLLVRLRKEGAHADYSKYYPKRKAKKRPKSRSK